MTDSHEQDPKDMEPAPKPKTKSGLLIILWLLALLLVAGIAAAAVYFVTIKPFESFINEQRGIVSASDEASLSLGQNIVFGPQTIKKEGDFTYITTEVSGEQASGTYELVSRFEEGEWKRERISLSVNDQEFDLDPEAIFDFEITEPE